MTPEKLPAISVIEPINPALEKVKTLLFKPFEVGKWFTIGFCAWLAFLGRSGVGFRFNFPFGNSNSHICPLGQVQNLFYKNLTPIIVLASIGLLIGLAIMVVLLWLSCRGQFMFLHCIAQNKAEVKIPWHKFRRHANNLLLFKLVAGFIAFICLALCTAPIALMIIFLTRGPARIGAAGIFAIVCLSLVMAFIAVIFVLFFKFTNDFAIPIMYLDTSSCTEAWRQLLTMLSLRKGAFILYVLFQIVIAMAIAVILMALILGTCCCAACFLAIPYLGTVLCLPLLVFKRSYSLYYLRQFAPGFDVFDTSIIMPQPDSACS
ncbi:MAG: hypothetical protein JXB29_08290 [Sedimentisphaerales bacterium]|nr:hypothetical protein [Sedimentisphaerales bacterium]